MAELIEEIDKLPLKEQELVLQQLSDDYVPIQIDDAVFMIPPEVDNLIENLFSQIHRKEIAITKN